MRNYKLFNSLAVINQSNKCSDLMARTVNSRKFILIIGIVLILKLSWNLLNTSKDMTDVNEMENHPDFGFKPQSCVMVDGKCKPLDSAGIPPVTGKGLYAHKDSFYLDGQPFRILSGSFHYFRMQPALWGDRLLRMKAAGLNTVTTYVAWNVHEKIRQGYRFGGRYDIASFIQQAQKVGLYVIIRAGPYICAEWEFGGFPSWLLHNEDVVLRKSTYKPYLSYIEDYFSKLLPIIAKYTHKRGGPVFAFQIENEYGSLQHQDIDYLKFLLDLHKKFGIDELFMTSDGSKYFQYGTLPGVLATVNFANNPGEQLGKLKLHQPDKPMMVMEFWSGWFDHWGERHHSFTANDLKERLEVILKFNASVNFYMFVGSTNFGFYNGANNGSVYKPTITSYDYDAPIAEHGDITPKYKAIRETLIKFNLGPVDLPAVPSNPDKQNYGNVKITHYVCYSDMVALVESIHGKIVLNKPVPMERLDINNKGGQGYGYILYRSIFDRAEVLKIKGIIQDRAQVIINGKQIALIDYNDHPYKDIHLEDVSLKDAANQLDIFVENMGRVNYKAAQDISNLFESQTKGIKGVIEIDNKVLTAIQHIPFEFNQEFRTRLSSSTIWKEMNGEAPNLPCAFRGEFQISDSPIDTFLDTSNWNKGVVFINGFNLGRYWHVGPQKTLYVPAPLLTIGKNEIIIFELQIPFNEVHFTDSPNLG